MLLGEQPLEKSSGQVNQAHLIHRDLGDDESVSPPIVTSKKSSQEASDRSFNEKNEIFNAVKSQSISPVLTPPSDRQVNLEKEKTTTLLEDEPKKKKVKDPELQVVESKEKEGEENDSFHRLYNKEIKVNQDEIPLLLLELTDIAYKFIKKDQFEKAYVLLQKTESVLEVVNLEHSKRDRYFAYITYHNMAMCFQKLGMLEECIIYLKETIQVIEKPNFFKDISIATRMKQRHMQCQLKLQLCAILSQTQKHTEAMENAKISVRMCHQILRDIYDLCVFYSNKIKFKDDFASLSLLLVDENDDNSSKSSKDKNQLNEKMLQKQYIREHSPVKDIPYNILEESISMIERTALKLLPIMKELGNRLAGINGKRGLEAFHAAPADDSKKLTDKNMEVNKDKLNEQIKKKKEGDKGLAEESDDEQDIKDVDLKVESKNEKEGEKVDMRTVLGFLNQNEWILNLNIGNIMQIQAVRMKDFMQSYRNEHQLSRESFLEKLQLLIVSYFCVSTEMRFIIQSRSGFMKPEVKKEKELEQEYWHVKALDIACAFLPSECPLFNHILLSYQKHHDPTMQPINEDEEQEDVITVLRPLKGIENSKYQPLVRELHDVYIDIADIPTSPLSKCFDHRLLPRNVKTSSMTIQTDPVEKPKPPMMKSQSISVQEDMKLEDEQKKLEKEQKKKKAQDSQTSTDIFDNKNAYMDLSSHKYEESLMSKIMEDPKISDKQQFLSKLISRVQSQDPESFRKSTQAGLTNVTYANTQSQNLNIAHSHLVSFQQNHDNNSMKGTLTAAPSGNIEHDIYGKKQQLATKGSKITQSGQINYKTSKRGQNNQFDPIDFKSFDQKSQVNKHVKSLYGETSNENTTIGYGAKHHIASQSLAPSHSVFTEKPPQKTKQSQQLISTHKKHQSISGGNSEDLISKNLKKEQHSVQLRNFNNSVNSATSKQKKQQKTDIKQKKNGIKNYSNINLSNQKQSSGQRKPSKYLLNHDTKKAVPKQKKQQQIPSKIHKIPTTKNDNVFDDVMSNSSQNDSNPEFPQPDSSCSDTGMMQIGPKSPILMNQISQDESVVQSDSQVKQKAVVQKQRPSSAITNYTSGTQAAGAHSVVKTRQNKQRLQNVQSLNRMAQVQTQKTTKVAQQQQNIVNANKQGKQKQIYNGAPLVPKKKPKVLSRKRYGSDRSSNSPPLLQQFGTQDHESQNQIVTNQLPHGYSIAQQPFSIFDSGNTHSISKLSNQQSKQSITNFDSNVNSKGNLAKVVQKEPQPRKKSTNKVTHSNSQLLHSEKRQPGIQNNQSENILAKLQNLLQNKEEERSNNQRKNNGQNGYSNQRKYANSNGSLRQSRYSQNSKYSRSKSRVSRSKSSGNGRSGGAEKAASKSRENIENTGPREINNSVLTQNYMEIEQSNEKQNQSSFELNQILKDLPQQDATRKRKAGRSGALRSRPKSSLLFENPSNFQKEMTKKPKQKKVSNPKGNNHHSSIENLQRQVLENQKILLNNMQKKKRNPSIRHNHNNSIGHMNRSQMQTQNLRNQIAGNKSILSSGHSMSGISGISGTKKKQQSRKQQNPVQAQTQNILNSYNTSQILNCLAQNMQNIQKSDLSLKMTQPNANYKTQNFANLPQGVSTSTASTSGAQFHSGKPVKTRKAQKQRRGSIATTNGFVNFEQMQQQLEGGLTLGGVDLQDQAQNQEQFEQAQTMLMHLKQISEKSGNGGQQQLNFIPHKNLMPKTTGSQAHLLSVQEADLQKQYNSLNQTGRTQSKGGGKKRQNN